MMVAVVFQILQPSSDCLTRRGNPFCDFLRINFEYGSFVEMFPCLISCGHVKTFLDQYGNVPKKANGKVCNIDHFPNCARAPLKRESLTSKASVR